MNIRKYLDLYILFSSQSIELAIKLVNTNDLRSVCVVDAEFNLIGTITDGDIRRGFLSGLGISDSCSMIANTNCIKAEQGEERELFFRNKITLRMIPVVKNGQLIDLKMLKNRRENVKAALVMAGGFGKRMGQLTNDTPKPMLYLNEKPMLEWIINSLKSQGINKIFISVFYKSEQIKEYFDDGRKFDVSIEYLEESTPLGTGGCLALLKQPQDLIVLNGDIISHINFQNFASFCNELNADAGLVVKRHEIRNPFGVVEADGFELTDFKEKPVYSSSIAAGIYYIRKQCLENLDLLKIDMPDFLLEQRIQGKKIVVYPYEENYWIDVGVPTAIKQASVMLKD
ncbi:sugar phosphate nucleotidyltransferase [Planktomarina temperata]|nr:sugar phosphate nucleotidyltransferase [Planktomarina temperata]